LLYYYSQRESLTACENCGIWKARIDTKSGWLGWRGLSRRCRSGGGFGKEAFETIATFSLPGRRILVSNELVLSPCICLTIRYRPRRLNGNKIQVCKITRIFSHETRSVDGDLDVVTNLSLSREVYRRWQR